MLTVSYTFDIEFFPVAAMECLKDCCKNLMKRKGKEQETQGKLMSCTALNQTALTECFVSDGGFPLLSSDHTEDAS